jgi:hypothetical protein
VNSRQVCEHDRLALQKLSIKYVHPELQKLKQGEKCSALLTLRRVDPEMGVIRVTCREGVSMKSTRYGADCMYVCICMVLLESSSWFSFSLTNWSEVSSIWLDFFLILSNENS